MWRDPDEEEYTGKMWYEYPLLASRAEFLTMLREGLTYDEIARLAGCSLAAVRTAQARHRLRKPLVILHEELAEKLGLREEEVRRVKQ